MSRRLVTIITDVPITFEIDRFRLVQKDTEAIKALFEHLEFRALLPRVLSAESNIQNEKKSKEIQSNNIGQMNLFTNAESPLEVIKSMKI